MRTVNDHAHTLFADLAFVDHWSLYCPVWICMDVEARDGKWQTAVAMPHEG